MYCIVENPNPTALLSRFMIVLQDSSVKASGWHVLVFGLTGMQQANHFKHALGLDRKEMQ